VISSTHSAAAFTVGGEGAQAFTLVIPTSITLNGPAGAHLTVTTTNDVSTAACPTLATCTLSGSLGGAGALSFHVGGSFPLSSGQTSGAYTNTTDLTVTATYN
jgi:hypothetical protein